MACSPNLCLCGQHQSAALVSLRWLTAKCTQLCLISCLIYYVYINLYLYLYLLIGVKGRTKFLNFNSGTCMPSHVTKIRWSVKTIYPQDRPTYCRTNTPKPNGGPVDEKIFFFQKLSLIIFKTLPNDCICQADSEKVYNLGSVHPICTVHALCTLRARCISRARFSWYECLLAEQKFSQKVETVINFLHPHPRW